MILHVGHRVLKDAGQPQISPQEVLKVIGFLYGMTVHPYRDSRIHWSVAMTVRIATFLLQHGVFDLVWGKEGLKPSFVT